MSAHEVGAEPEAPEMLPSDGGVAEPVEKQSDDLNQLTSMALGQSASVDVAAWEATVTVPAGTLAATTEDTVSPYVSLKFGYQRRLSEHWTCRLDQYHVLGWADIDLNQRNYINRNSDYRSKAAASGVSSTANF